jgi:hypothetical protein
VTIPVDVPDIEALARQVAPPNECRRESGPQDRLQLLRPSASPDEERIDHRPKTSVARRVGDDHRALARTSVPLRGGTVRAGGDVNYARMHGHASLRLQPMKERRAEGQPSFNRLTTRHLRGSGDYSPITLQMKPIEMKKPENRAISPMPP